MQYFTIWHILVIISSTILFFAICVCIYLLRDKINAYAAIGLNFTLFVVIVISSMFIVDSYTKNAAIENIATRRVLANETIVYTGLIRNLGKYHISKCILDVKMSTAFGNLSDMRAHLTKNNQFFSFLYKNEREDLAPVSSTIEIKALKPYEIRNFTAILKYPPNFQNVKFTHTLSCR